MDMAPNLQVKYPKIGLGQAQINLLQSRAVQAADRVKMNGPKMIPGEESLQEGGSVSECVCGHTGERVQVEAGTSLI